MSTKTKASSKNKNAASKKPVKKAASQNRDKKTVAKKKVVKTSKPVSAKPAVKKTAKATPKKVASGASATGQKAVKKVTKTTVKATVSAKKPVKAIKKAVSPAKKAVPAKITIKKAVTKKAVVKKAVKKAAPKARPVVAKKAAKPLKKAVVKKAIVKAPAKKAVNVVKAKAAPAKKINQTATKAKSVVVKNQAIKPEPIAKAPVEKAVKASTNSATKALVVKTAKPVIKKSIVAPITFRQEDPGPVKFIKEPNGKFEMEFVIRASEDMVFEFVSTESGLSEWFCDDVTIRNGVFTFIWDGQEQQAKLVKEIPPTFIRYQWTDKNDGSYFEFKTQKDELTNDISLIITDFASDKSDEESARLLWHSQVDKLLHVLGSVF